MSNDDKNQLKDSIEDYKLSITQEHVNINKGNSQFNADRKIFDEKEDEH